MGRFNCTVQIPVLNSSQPRVLSPSQRSPKACGCEGLAEVAQVIRANQSRSALPTQPEAVQVFDPVNKKQYSLKFIGSKKYSECDEPHSDIIPTVGLSTYFTSKMSGVNKRFFLCKQYQNNRCRAFYNCNSIHACRKSVSELRAAHPPTKEAMEADILIPVYSAEEDEQFVVPMDKTEATEGRDITRSRESAGLLCAAYETKHSRCTAGRLCPNIHVDSNHMKHVKEMWKLPCCSDKACIGAAAGSVQFPRVNGHDFRGVVILDNRNGRHQPHILSRSAVGVTRGLLELCARGDAAYDAAGQILKVSQGKLCRPHQRKACKWGSSCNNVHVCRHKMIEFSAVSTSASSSEFSTPTTSPRHVCRIAGVRSPNCSNASSPASSPKASPRIVLPQATSNPVPVVPHSMTIPTPGALVLPVESSCSLTPILSSFREHHLPTGGINGFILV